MDQRLAWRPISDLEAQSLPYAAVSVEDISSISRPLAATSVGAVRYAGGTAGSKVQRPHSQIYWTAANRKARLG